METEADRERLLGEYVVAERRRVFGHKAAGVRGLKLARATLDSVEAGNSASDASYHKLEEAFRWPAGSARRYVRDGGPLPAAEPDKARLVDRSHLTREQALALLWAATGAEDDLDKIREVRRIEAEILGDVR